MLQAIAPLAADDVVLGQYSRSQVGCGYLEEPSVRNKASCTETFAAAVLHIDNPRWAGARPACPRGGAAPPSLHTSR